MGAIVKILSESSTSLIISEINNTRNNDYVDVLNAISLNSTIRKGTKRLKIHQYVENVVHHYLDDTFMENFRMKKVSFELLRLKISPILHRYGPGQPQINTEKQLLLTIWTLANLECFRSLSERFGVSKSTAVHSF